MQNNILIVGAGFAGAVYARQLAEKDYHVTVIDKRNHIAGNCYDYVDNSGIRIHKYGPHLFHTSNIKVFDYLSRFTKWIKYEHKVVVRVGEDKLVPLPINIHTINTIFNKSFESEQEVKSFIDSLRIKNQEIINIYTALGVTVGTEEDSKALNLEKLRYHKIVIMCDADVDGSHISTLILTFFFRYMRELIESGHVYIATPPLYLVKKASKKEYAWSDDDRDKLMEDFGTGSSVQRYKGLGEMNAIQLWETTMNPDSRTFRKVTIDNAGEADRVFSMLMGDEVPPRRDFIERNATYANIDA